MDKNLNITFSEKLIGDSIDNQIYVSTYSGIINRKNEFKPDDFRYIVVDEAHHSVAPGMAKILKYFNADFLLGMTATPERLDKKN